MAFALPTMSDTLEFLVGVGKAVFPDRNYGNPRSYHRKRATFLAAAVTQVIAYVRSVMDDVMPDTAPDDGPIDRWGGIKGVIRKGATPARKSAAGRVVGTTATAVPFGQELVHLPSGLRFKIATGTSVPIAGFIDADIVAIDVGAQTRISRGETLSFVATPAGLSTEVVLQLDLDQDGYDREQYGAYRGRVLDSFSKPTSGGAQADYVAWGLQVTNVSAAFAFPNRQGVGTVDVVGLHSGSGTARVLSGGELGDYVTYLKTKAPASVAATNGSLRGLTITTDPQSVELVLTPNGDAANAFDWTGGPLTVLTWTAGTRALQMAGALPSSIKAGHRLCLKGVASAQDGKEYKIEALSGVDTVILEVAPPVAPAATDLVYSGGPLVTPIRDAILGHMNGETVYAAKGGLPEPISQLSSTVGLEVLADGIGPANPGGKYGTWSGGLIRAVLGKIAIYKSGVRNYNIVTPGADYEATDYAFPLDAQIGLIVPLAVLVRGAT